MNNEIKVSVICTAFNHEKYIRQCLDGIVMQQADFDFEVLVNDDASADRTAEIIGEYEARYPAIIKPVYQKHNQYSQGVDIIGSILLPIAKGAYIAFCEGDDYWTDPKKLQRQIDAMNRHPDCNMCVTRVDVVEEDDTYSRLNQNRIYTEETGIIDSDRFVRLVNPYLYQLSGMVLKTSIFREYYADSPEFVKIADVGDMPIQLFFTQSGPVYYIDESMSHYRINSIGSWHGQQQAKQKKIRHVQCMIDMLYAYDRYTNQRFHAECMRRIANYQLDLASCTQEYRWITQRNNQEIFSQQSWKYKTNVYLHILFPKMADPMMEVLTKKYIKMKKKFGELRYSK